MPMPPPGVHVPLLTLYDAAEEIDVDATAAFARRLVDAGVHGLVLAGSTGEFHLHTPAERRALLEAVIAACPGTPVLAQVGAPAQRDAVALAEHAAAGGRGRRDADHAVLQPRRPGRAGRTRARRARRRRRAPADRVHDARDGGLAVAARRAARARGRGRRERRQGVGRGGRPLPPVARHAARRASPPTAARRRCSTSSRWPAAAGASSRSRTSRRSAAWRSTRRRRPARADALPTCSRRSCRCSERSAPQGRRRPACARPPPSATASAPRRGARSRPSPTTRASAPCSTPRSSRLSSWFAPALGAQGSDRLADIPRLTPARHALRQSGGSGGGLPSICGGLRAPSSCSIAKPGREAPAPAGTPRPATAPPAGPPPSAPRAPRCSGSPRSPQCSCPGCCSASAPPDSPAPARRR